jgi:hypothetical protein
MPRLTIALVAPVFLALICVQFLSGCIFVPVDGRGRGGSDRGGYERGGYGHDRYDDHRR